MSAVVAGEEAPAEEDEELAEEQAGENGYESVRDDFNHGAIVLASVHERRTLPYASRAQPAK